MTFADSVHLLTLEARGVLSPPDRIHTQARLTPDNQEQRPSRRRECRKAVSSAPSEFTLANGAPGPCPTIHRRRLRPRGAHPGRARGDPEAAGAPTSLLSRASPSRPAHLRSAGVVEASRRARPATASAPPSRPAAGSFPLLSPCRWRLLAAVTSPFPGGARADLESSEVRRAVRPRGREPRAREEAARRSTTFRDVMLTREGAGGPQSRDSPGTQSRSSRSLLAFYLQKQMSTRAQRADFPRSHSWRAQDGVLLSAILCENYWGDGPDSTEHTSGLLSAESSFYTANLEQKGEEVMKRINTLLLILATSEALQGKSEVTGILEEGHLAIRKFQRDVVTARHTVVTCFLKWLRDLKSETWLLSDQGIYFLSLPPHPQISGFTQWFSSLKLAALLVSDAERGLHRSILKISHFCKIHARGTARWNRALIIHT
ncbi:uncharacterized protein LOC111185313 [Delphinapterus leucas]|uniref:Uncharacterized protein LOC111185313 n=1 Tax=Delphinapterus leucas TaxID=9749 RepID=A0A2Y9PUI9_DELLE|nr:uncharacterized protein LOC111185313 [Delphinapterus leucas]